jgi:hypothetical protein
MAIDFPANPTNGQQYQNFYYDSSITAWRNLGSKNALSSAVTGLQTANATTNQSGLVPVIPTSVSVGSGSASVSSNGVVTFTAASSVQLNGVFSSAYKNYKIMWSSPIDAANNCQPNRFQARFTTGGTPNSTSNYKNTSWYTQGGTTGNDTGTSTSTTIGTLSYGAEFEMTLFSPFDSSRGTEMHFLGNYTRTLIIGQMGFDAAASFDGIQISNNTYTGTVQVYGLRN